MKAECFRGLNCEPLSWVSAGDAKDDFVCIGCNAPESRKIDGDIYTFCVKSSIDVDSRQNCDYHDLISQMVVTTQAVAMIHYAENNEVRDELHQP